MKKETTRMLINVMGKGETRLLAWLAVLVFCLLSVQESRAGSSYRSEEVKRLLTALQLNVDSLVEGTNSFSVRDRQVKVVLNQGQVSFVGYHLFPDELKALARTPILSFLERYFLQIDYPQADRPATRMMREDRFRFNVGSQAVVPTLRPEDAFKYGFENKRYTASWSRAGQTILSVSFPAEHELISGENKIEAEACVENDIRQSPFDGILPVNEAVLSPTVQKDYFVKQGGKYMKDLLVSDLYYQRVDSAYVLLSDESHPLESAANLMLSPESQLDCTLKIRQVMYGYKKKQFEVPLRNWIAYCIKAGCELYFGAESMDEKEIKATVIAVNVAENYNHVLFVNIPMAIFSKGSGTIDANLDTFIPMHNVMNLFAKYQRIRNKQLKIYE